MCRHLFFLFIKKYSKFIFFYFNKNKTTNKGVQNEFVRPQRAGRQAQVHAAMSLSQDVWRDVFPRQRENEGQKQAGRSSTRHYQGVNSAGRREEQRVSQCVSARVREKMGSVAQYVHARFW